MSRLFSFGLLRYVLQRLGVSVLTLFALASMTFVLMRAVPGDPLTRTKEIPAAVKANLMAKYGLDRPMYEQYAITMKHIFIDLDFGDSFRTVGRSVNKMIAEQFPASATLGLVALIFGTTIGLILGIVAALYRNTWIDRSIMVICVLGIAIPSALMVYLVQYTFAVYPLTKLGMAPDFWFRTVGWGQVRDIILPAFTLGLGILATMTRYMRSQMVDVSFSDYIKTAKAKGASTFRIIFSHQVRNAILPIVSLLGPIFVGAISGTLVVESVFGVPGLGNAFINSITNNDYNVLMGLTIFFGGFFIFINLLTDILYGMIDPRIRIG